MEWAVTDDGRQFRVSPAMTWGQKRAFVAALLSAWPAEDPGGSLLVAMAACPEVEALVEAAGAAAFMPTRRNLSALSRAVDPFRTAKE